MIRNHRILFLLISITLFPTFCFSQTEVWKDSIEVLLNVKECDKSDVDKLNYYITEIWKAERVSDSTINNAIRIVDKSRRLGYDIGLADALINLVRCYLIRYDSSKSLEHALEANKIYEQHGDKVKMAYTKMQLGVIYYTQNNYLKSLDYYHQSILGYEALKDSMPLATLYYLCGINDTRLLNFNSANLNFNKALELKSKLKDQQGIAQCNIGISELLLEQKQPDSALVYIGEVEKYIINSGDKYGNAKAQLLKAKSYAMLNNFTDALSSAIKGLDLAKQINAKELVVDGNELLYKLNQNNGNYKNAFDYLLNYMSLRDSIFNEKTSRNFSRLETDYILEKKQSEILLLENENRNRTIMLRATIIIGILSLVLAFLFYNRFQIKQKANKRLEKANSELLNTQQQLVQQEKLASLGQLTAGIAHEIKNPLNFVNNFSSLSSDLIKEYFTTADEQTKSEILRDLLINIEKINIHGRRADSIVTKMLEHSRTGIMDKENTNINKLCREDINLAYKAVQLGNPGFNCKLNIETDEKIPEVKLVTQEISRVLLNIINNAFYANLEKQKTTPSEQTKLSLTTKLVDNTIKIIIRDSGNGVPQKIIENIFQPFFTTKPPGKGTGLGLSISYDIIKAHGGDIVVSNHAEGGAEFIISLPVNYST